MLFTSEGTPLPPVDVTRRLQEFDARYFLKFLPGMEGWALARRWRENDARREMIQRGEMSPDSDWDILTMIPTDCSVEQAASYLLRMPKYAGDREIEALCDRLLVENAIAEQANVDAHTRSTDEWIEVRGHRLTDTPRVFNAGIPEPAPVPKKKGKKK